MFASGEIPEDGSGSATPGADPAIGTAAWTAETKLRRQALCLLWALVSAACTLLGSAVQAGKLTRFELEVQADGYRLQSQGLIEAPKDAVRQVLTDYSALHRVSPRIIESELVAVTADGISRVRTLNRLCFLWLCRDLRHVQRIRERGYGDFESQSVAAESDLSRGYARWRLEDLGGATRLDIDFSFAMESDAWVPSFISRFVARTALEEDAETLIDGIERAARRRLIQPSPN